LESLRNQEANKGVSLSWATFCNTAIEPARQLH